MRMPNLIHRRPLLIISALLGLQTVLLQSLSFDESSVTVPTLETLPSQIGDWKVTGDRELNPWLRENLRPDAYALPVYTHVSRGQSVGLVVTYFKSLAGSGGPHPPEYCLPGHGWIVQSKEVLNLAAAGAQKKASINCYGLKKDSSEQVVLFWYQNRDRVWDSYVTTKLRLLPDLVRYRRSDVALVEVAALVREADVAGARASALEFARLILPVLEQLFGST